MLALFLLGLMQPAVMPVTSEGPEGQSIALYGDLAFITETRVVDLPAGRSKIVLQGVNRQMVPQTAILRSFEGMTVERNFDQGCCRRSRCINRL